MLEARRFISGAEGHGVAPEARDATTETGPVKPCQATIHPREGKERKGRHFCSSLARARRWAWFVSGVWSGQKWDGTMERRDAVFDRDKAGESAHTRTPCCCVLVTTYEGQVLACKHNLSLLCAWVLVVEWLA